MWIPISEATPGADYDGFKTETLTIYKNVLYRGGGTVWPRQPDRKLNAPASGVTHLYLRDTEQKN